MLSEDDWLVHFFIEIISEIIVCNSKFSSGNWKKKRKKI